MFGGVSVSDGREEEFPMLRTGLRSFLTLPLTALVLALLPVTGPTHVAAEH
jgi:hypothetical protein